MKRIALISSLACCLSGAAMAQPTPQQPPPPVALPYDQIDQLFVYLTQGGSHAHGVALAAGLADRIKAAQAGAEAAQKASAAETAHERKVEAMQATIAKLTAEIEAAKAAKAP